MAQTQQMADFVHGGGEPRACIRIVPGFGIVHDGQIQRAAGEADHATSSGDDGRVDGTQVTRDNGEALVGSFHELYAHSLREQVEDLAGSLLLVFGDQVGQRGSLRSEAVVPLEVVEVRCDLWILIQRKLKMSFIGHIDVAVPRLIAVAREVERVGARQNLAADDLALAGQCSEADGVAEGGAWVKEGKIDVGRGERQIRVLIAGDGGADQAIDLSVQVHRPCQL